MKPEGVFSTPNYPQPYPHDTKCLWTIQVDYGHLIEITFHDFDFESASSTECQLDGLSVSRSTLLFVALLSKLIAFPQFRS